MIARHEYDYHAGYKLSQTARPRSRLLALSLGRIALPPYHRGRSAVSATPTITGAGRAASPRPTDGGLRK